MTETRPAKSRGGVRGSGDEVRQQRGRGQCQTGQDTWGRAPVLPLAPRRGCYRAVGRPSRVQGSRVALALGRSSAEPVPSPAEQTSLEEAERLTGLKCRAAGRVTAQGAVSSARVRRGPAPSPHPREHGSKGEACFGEGPPVMSDIGRPLRVVHNVILNFSWKPAWKLNSWDW